MNAANWNNLPFYQKIRLEGPKLTKKYGDTHLNKIAVKSLLPTIFPSLKFAKLVKTFRNPAEFQVADIRPDHILKASRGSGMVCDLATTTSLSTIHNPLS